MTERRKEGIAAWLVTWKHVGDNAKPERRIAAILSPHWSADRVRNHVEWLYVNETFSLKERIAYAKRKHLGPWGRWYFWHVSHRVGDLRKTGLRHAVKAHSLSLALRKKFSKLRPIDRIRSNFLNVERWNA